MEMHRDLLTDLPDTIIERILTRMPIRDAVTTSLLSTKWRYKWTEITQLVFDEKFGGKIKAKDFENNVNTTLFRLKGPIRKFELWVPILYFRPDMDSWILHLSRNGIREITLVLTNHYWNVPSRLFDCDKLTRLELHGCGIHTPKNFKGFSSLKILVLDDIFGSSEDIQFLISSCLILETLTVQYIHVISSLLMDAPRLKCLTFEGNHDDIILVNTPLLASFRVYIYSDYFDDNEKPREKTLVKSFGAMPPLERLVGGGFFTACLSVGFHVERISLAVTYSHLTVIELSDVHIEDIKQLEVVIRLLNISPILHTLAVTLSQWACIWESISWNKESFAGSTFECLRHVKLTNIRGYPIELLLIEFLLESSPVLETLKIWTLKPLGAAKRAELFSKLMGFRRTSALAQIIVLPEPSK